MPQAGKSRTEKKIFQKIRAKINRPEAWNFIKKETPTQVFSCEFCDIFKNNFFTEHLPATVSSLTERLWR